MASAGGGSVGGGGGVSVSSALARAGLRARGVEIGETSVDPNSGFRRDSAALSFAAPTPGFSMADTPVASAGFESAVSSGSALAAASRISRLYRGQRSGVFRSDSAVRLNCVPMDWRIDACNPDSSVVSVRDRGIKHRMWPLDPLGTTNRHRRYASSNGMAVAAGSCTMSWRGVIPSTEHVFTSGHARRSRAIAVLARARSATCSTE
mmetsp:Transcript_40262/g.124421  ORF Transcript_40262/g.124421 Transcript_40262/m.124421 type:complete len:207 (+) Transcript_40262:188-808(+)